MAKKETVVVPAGGQRDKQNGKIVAEVIADGVSKGWTYIATTSDFEENYVVFLKPSRETRG